MDTQKPLNHETFHSNFIFLPSIPSFAQSNSPQDTIKEWIKVYGVDQDRASELTTKRFREGKPKKTWADESYSLLYKIGYRHLGGKFLGQEIKRDGIEAMVILRSTIDTIVGKSEQTEVYLLFLINGKWLIDEIVVKDEVEIEEGEIRL